MVLWLSEIRAPLRGSGPVEDGVDVGEFTFKDGLPAARQPRGGDEGEQGVSLGCPDRDVLGCDNAVGASVGSAAILQGPLVALWEDSVFEAGGVCHLDELQARARAINTTLLDTERVGQGCVLASPAFERIARPSLTEEGRRAPALRFGDLRVQALAGALCTSVFAVTGITNKSLRALMTGLLGGAPYTMNQASYDLSRLRRQRAHHPHPGPQPLPLTRDGLRFALFYTKLHNRLLRPLLATDQPPAPPPLRKALHTIEFTSQKPSTRPDSYRTQPETQDNSQRSRRQGSPRIASRQGSLGRG